jgi:hypothetical protein
LQLLYAVHGLVQSLLQSLLHRLTTPSCYCTALYCHLGSSCGGWLALHAALQRPQRVAGLVLVAPAVDFTERVWSLMTQQQKQQLEEAGRLSLGSPYMDPSQDVVGTAFFQQGREMLLLQGQAVETAAAGTVPLQCPVHILHGVEVRQCKRPCSCSSAPGADLSAHATGACCLRTGCHFMHQPTWFLLMPAHGWVATCVPMEPADTTPIGLHPHHMIMCNAACRMIQCLWACPMASSKPWRHRQ